MRKVLYGLLGLLGLVCNLWAASDDLAGATMVTSLPFSATVDNSTFTVEASEPLHGGGSAGTFWYKYTPPSNTNLVISLSGVDAEIGVYTGDNHSSLIAVATLGGQDNPIDEDTYEDEDSTNEYGEFLIVPVIGGTEYKIQGAADSASDRGFYTIKIFSDSNLNGANDFANAIPITTSPFLDAVDNGNYDTETGEYACRRGYKSYWYRYTAPQSGYLKLYAWGYDTETGIFTSQTLPASYVTEVEGCSNSNNNSVGNYGEYREVPVTQGVTYYIKISDRRASPSWSEHLVSIEAPQPPQPPQSVPSMTFWGVGILTGLLGLIGIRKRLR